MLEKESTGQEDSARIQITPIGISDTVGKTCMATSQGNASDLVVIFPETAFWYLVKIQVVWPCGGR